MDSRTDEVGRKRRLAPRTETPSKRVKLDAGGEDEDAEWAGNESDGAHDAETNDSVVSVEITGPHNMHLRSRDSLPDDISDATFPQFKGSAENVTLQVKRHVKKILTLGKTATTLSNKDVILAARAPDTSAQQTKDIAGSQDLPKAQSRDKQFGRSQISERVVVHCATTLSKDLIGLATFIRPNIAQVLPFSKQDFCYLLRYSSQLAAADALSKIQTVLCKIRGVTIPLQGFGPDVMREPSVQGRLLATCPEGKQFNDAVIRLVLKEKAMLNESEIDASQANSIVSEQPSNSGSEQHFNPSTGVDLSQQTHDPEINLSEKKSDTHLDTSAIDVTPAPTSDEATVSNRDPFGQATAVQLKDLSADERKLQTRYWGITRYNELARCPVCSEPGHMSAACPSRTCKYCGAVDVHFSANCPTRTKCPKCHERGHGVAQCQSKLMRTNADGYDCDTCHEDHKEDDCSWLWRTFDPAKLAPEKLKKVKTLQVFCYECGSSGHWGDDCLGRPKSKATVSNNDVFSAKFANQFLENPPLVSTQQTKQISIHGAARKPTGENEYNGDELGDASSFIGKKINTTLPPRPQIQVNTRQGYTNEFKPINAYTRRPPPSQPPSYRSVPPPHEQQYYPRNHNYARSRAHYEDDEDRLENGRRSGYRGGEWRHEQYPRSIDLARSRHVDGARGDGNGNSASGWEGSSGWTHGPRQNFYG